MTPLTPEAIALIKVLSDLLITISFTLNRINRMSDEEASAARESAEKLSDNLISKLGPRHES